MVEKWDPVLGPWEPQDLLDAGTSMTPGTTRIPGTSRTPRTPSTSGSHEPPRNSGASDPLGPQDLRTSGKLPQPFEIQNLNAVQLLLICCKKYRNEVSHRCGPVVFLERVQKTHFVKYLQVPASKFGLLIRTTKLFSLILSPLVTYFKNICLKVSLICKST